MMQLWLDGRRIDSIPQLRRAFASQDAEGRRSLFGQLLRKHAAGIFLPWLARCPEARIRQGSRESGRDAVFGALNLESARLRLEKSGTATPPDEVRDAIAKICGIDPAEMPAEDPSPSANAGRTAGGGGKEALATLLERQQWYHDDSRLRDFILTLPPDRIVTDTDSLKKILTRLARRNDTQMADIYLLAVEGQNIFLRNVDKLRHVRLVGYGRPIFRFSSTDYGKTLDMDAADVKFEGLVIDRQDVRVVNRGNRCIAVDWGDRTEGN